MELLQQIFEWVSDAFGGFSQWLEKKLTSIFGSSNARFIKKLQPTVEAINEREPHYQAMSDDELREQTTVFRKRLAAGETLDDLLVDAFAVCREAGRRVLGMRHYDVQLLGGIVLHRGNIAEMVTGEGKTLVATLPAYLNALTGKGVHVVTVNDYLARRDMEWMGPLYMALGLTVGAIQSNIKPDERQRAYECDITYGTNNEFGFDYLRDNMRYAAKGDDHFPKMHQQAQGPLNYAIIDEVDNILIDEARTPLIISGPAHDDVSRYRQADRIARQLKKDVHFEVNEKDHSAHLTDEGVRRAEELAGVESFYTAGNMEWPHLIDNSLKAHHLYKRDVNYVIQNQEIVIVDEFTGRLMPGRNWSDGLHQAVEAKEGVPVKQENQTLATVTLQNYFKLYDKISGMTGTAMTEASEFWKIYQLDVISVPTNRPLQRASYPDAVYRSEREKYTAIADEIERIHKWDILDLGRERELMGRIQKEEEHRLEFQPKGMKKTEWVPKDKILQIHRRGRPILVGTVSIERSELISSMLQKRGIPHEVLNAKHHKREAEIVAQAGRKGAVTIATNMAGRGTDIILGGNPEAMAWGILQETYPSRLDIPQEEWDSLVAEIEQREQMKPEGEEVRRLGGLHIVGTERHEARRIDLQLRGRCGRQGDPGSSRFFLSLEDDLMRIFAGEWVKNILTRIGMEEGQAIESRMISRRIEGAQKKVEERNFEIRKNLLEYDEVMDQQRKRVYGYRQDILDGAECRQLIFDMLSQQIEEHISRFLEKDYGAASFASWAGMKMSIEFETRDFRNMDFNMAEEFAKDQAKRLAENQVLDDLEENLPSDAERSDWNWQALTKSVNARWKASLRDSDLKQAGRENVDHLLIEKAHQFIDKVDLSEGAHFLEPDFGTRAACAWVMAKFGLQLELDEMSDLSVKEFQQKVLLLASEKYREKEVEFPVLAGLIHFTVRDPGGHKRYDREPLAKWCRERFNVDLSVDDIKNKQREQIRQLLIEQSRKAYQRTRELADEAKRRLDDAFEKQARLQEEFPSELGPRLTEENPEVGKLCQWVAQEFQHEMTVEEACRLQREELTHRVINALEERYRPEMRKMERSLLLNILDAGWKDHLLVMDHLRNSIGLRGYAQVDPKVEYKREGMRIFEEMWSSVGERVTDLIFRMEQLDEGFVGSTWTETEAVHEKVSGTASADSIQEQQEAAIEGSQSDKKPQPIRNRGKKVGRNDPCPCGSGKKYKVCCMKKQRAAG